ncbi:hypothetical protein CH289_07860 [Rhodococcus sp. RS1C4]|nr:hypothetical protein [Rhodococcus sp. RS1C4]OZC55097.1 hypothetical protein CH289_07860 [Rhodococcus sp. RS1C4]
MTSIEPSLLVNITNGIQDGDGVIHWHTHLTYTSQVTPDTRRILLNNVQNQAGTILGLDDMSVIYRPHADRPDAYTRVEWQPIKEPPQ